MPKVDPFIPVNKRPRSGQPVRSQFAHPRPLTTPPTPHPAKQRPEPPSQSQPGRLRRIAVVTLQIIGLFMLFALGFLARSVVIGQAIVILYAIFAFVFKIESRTTFILALMSFFVVVVATIRSDTGLAALFATYAFLLLIVGAISLAREVRDEI